MQRAIEGTAANFHHLCGVFLLHRGLFAFLSQLLLCSFNLLTVIGFAARVGESQAEEWVVRAFGGFDGGAEFASEGTNEPASMIRLRRRFVSLSLHRIGNRQHCVTESHRLVLLVP